MYIDAGGNATSHLHARARAYLSLGAPALARFMEGTRATNTASACLANALDKAPARLRKKPLKRVARSAVLGTL